MSDKKNCNPLESVETHKKYHVDNPLTNIQTEKRECICKDFEYEGLRGRTDNLDCPVHHPTVESWEKELSTLLTKMSEHYLIDDEFEAQLKWFISSQIQQAEERNMRVEGLHAVIKFIRNKARRDIMKADLYGQGYYQAIKDLEDYFGVDIGLATLKEEK